MDWSAELLSLVAGSPRIAKHVHIPLQSGSDAVLKRMYREYAFGIMRRDFKLLERHARWRLELM